jgi:soluble lytic murein transglycosylase-like protein
MRTFHNIGRRLALVAGFAAVPLLAGENAILSNGFRLHADRHEASGSMVKLYEGTGFTEIPAAQIVSFEEDEAVPTPVPAVSAPAVPAVPIAPVAVADARQPLDPKRLADEAARRYNLPEALIRSIIRAESGFRQDAISPKGAIGLMQLMPATAGQLHANPHDPKENVEAGTVYLRDLLLKYENHEDQVARAVAAYNAGPGAVDRYNGIPPYRETREYVIRVLSEYKRSLEAGSHGAGQ